MQAMNADPRILQLRSLGARIGQNVFLGPDVYIEHDFAPFLMIEDGVVLARGVCVILHDSALNNVAGEPIKFGRVILRENCYLGANSTILCGVEIGARAVIGACSLVISDIPAEMVAYGQPARVTGTIQELIAKQRQAGMTSQRYYYLDLAPWRERQVNADKAEAASISIATLLQRVAQE
jgi:acetyltransferase-like isoleucine patch superfamily enzyme